jgi:signal transduction histidine kinase
LHDTKERTKQLLIGIVILVLLSQVIFWLGLGFAESMARPDVRPGPGSITMYPADEHGQPLAGIQPVRVPLLPEPAYVFADSERYPRALFVEDFEYSGGDTDFGVMLGWSRRIVEVRLNGVPLKTESPTDIWGILGGFDPVVYSFPAEYLRHGTNRLELLNSGRSKKILPYFFIGDLSALYIAHTWSRIFSVDLVLASIGVMLFVILLCLLIDWPHADRLRIRTLILLLAAWTMRNLTLLGVDGGLPDPLRLLSHFIVTYLFLFALLVFALGWTRRPRWSFKVSAMLLAAICAVAGITAFISDTLLFRVAFTLETVVTFLIGGLVLLLFADYWVKNGRKETVEILLFLVCTAAVMVDSIDDKFQITVPFVPDLPLTFYAAPMCGLLLALGMVASLAAQSTRARIATENVNELLTTKLKQQEERLVASHRRESELVKQQVLDDERQRITRDMHDGVGGSLMSLLLQAKRNELNSDTLVRSLSASMNDLRLIIDSFDHVGDNLEYALSMFRQRFEPELKQFGVTLHYQTTAAAAIGGFGPASVLQIYRILQEACNNAVNHGKARNIFIELSTDEKERTVCLSVRDDGQGMDTSIVSAGRGLHNMRHRASTLAGDITLTSDRQDGGTVVWLTFPMRGEPPREAAESGRDASIT